jgi:hypothetical protein
LQECLRNCWSSTTVPFVSDSHLFAKPVSRAVCLFRPSHSNRSLGSRPPRKAFSRIVCRCDQFASSVA